MYQIKKCIMLFVLLDLVILSCALNHSLPSGTAPTIQPVYTPVGMLSTQVFENINYDENYLSDCRLEFPPIYDHQVGFHDVYPGITTVASSLERLGQDYKRYEIGNGKVLYSYDTYNFAASNEIVEDIVVTQDSGVAGTLGDIFENYGCPDLIVASALSDDSYGSSLVYNHTYLVYSVAGVGINFDNYPVEYSNPAVGLVFSKPISAAKYLESIADDLESKRLMLVSFSEAIVDK